MKLNFAELTDIGLVRKANEDSVGHLSFQETNGYGNVFIVCDGMGGHVGGARASQKAVETIKEYFSNQPNPNPQSALKEAIEFANMQIFAEAQSNPDFTGMGTTVTILLEKENFINIAHVGDSRIYINTDGVLHRITKDHSFVQGLVDAGQITDDQMESHPRKNELTRALGIADTVKVEVSDTPILAKKGDKFMLCSDGLCGLVNDTTMMNTLNDKKDIKAAAEELITLAKNAGGHDNISVTIIDVLDSSHTKSQFTDKSNVRLKKTKGITGTREVRPEELKGGTSEKINVMMKKMMLPAIIGLFVLLGGYFAWNILDKDSDTKNKGNGGKNVEVEVENPLIVDENKDIIEYPLVNENFEMGSKRIKEIINNLDLGYTYDEVKVDYIEFINDDDITLTFVQAKVKYYSSTDLKFNDASFIFKKKEYEEFLANDGNTSIEELKKKSAEDIRQEKARKLKNASNKHTAFKQFFNNNQDNPYKAKFQGNPERQAFKKYKNKFEEALSALKTAIDDESLQLLSGCISAANTAKSNWEETFKKDSDLPTDEELVQEYKDKIENWETYTTNQDNDDGVNLSSLPPKLPEPNCKEDETINITITIKKGDKTVNKSINHTVPKKSDDECYLEEVRQLEADLFTKERLSFDTKEKNDFYISIETDSKDISWYKVKTDYHNKYKLKTLEEKYNKELAEIKEFAGDNPKHQTQCNDNPDCHWFFANQNTRTNGVENPNQFIKPELNLLEENIDEFKRDQKYLKKQED